MPAKPEPQQNHLLAALSPEVQGRLFPYLELVPLPLRSVMYESGRAMRHVYFPTDAIISLQYVMENGASTAILVVGNEGLMGITLFMGGESTPSRSLVQSAGYAYRLPRQRVKEEFSRHGQLLVLMLRYTQALITQIAQTAVCNRHHSIDQQLCRWLLLSMDRLSDSRLTMTQEFIGNMLGVRREGAGPGAGDIGTPLMPTLARSVEVPHVAVAPDALDGLAAAVGSGDLGDDVLVAVAALGLGDAPVERDDLDRVREPPGGERPRVAEAVQRLDGPLADEVRRGVAVVARRGGAVAPVQPAAVLLLHDVAVPARRRIVPEVRRALRVQEGVAPDPRADAGPEQHPGASVEETVLIAAGRAIKLGPAAR